MHFLWCGVACCVLRVACCGTSVAERRMGCVDGFATKVAPTRAGALVFQATVRRRAAAGFSSNACTINTLGMNRPPLLLLAHCTVFRYYIAIFRYYIALCDCIDVLLRTPLRFLQNLTCSSSRRCCCCWRCCRYCYCCRCCCSCHCHCHCRCRCRCRCRCLRSLLSGPPYSSGKAGRYNPQGGAQGCATFL